jgi:hypothetical protein
MGRYPKVCWVVIQVAQPSVVLTVMAAYPDGADSVPTAMHVLASAQETSTRLKELPVDWTFWMVQVAPPSVLLTTEPPLTAMTVWAFGIATLESEFP